jgi:cytochrome c oxidase subunit IV
MFKRKPKMRTSAEKARRSQMNIFVRLCGCAYLIYIIVQLVRDDSSGLSSRLRYTVAAVFILLAAGIVVVTLVDFVRNLKAGAYKAASYTDDTEESVEAFRARQAAASAEGAPDGDDPGDGGALTDGGASEQSGPAEEEQAAADGPEAADDGGE